MATLTLQDDPTAARPVSHPTYPVAGRPVDAGALTFDWTPVPNVDTYRLQLAPSVNFDAPYVDDMVGRPATIDLDAALPGDAASVFWRVRPDTAGAQWSLAARFVVAGREDALEEGAVVVNADPVPVHPMADMTLDAGATAFEWEGVPEASGYQLRVAQSDEFDDPVVDLTLDRTTSIVLYEQLPEEARLYWRVRTLFPTGASGPWCSPTPFSTSPTAEATPDETASNSAEEYDEGPRAYARAAGPAEQARTSSAMSLTFILVVVLGFLLSVVLVAWYV